MHDSTGCPGTEAKTIPTGQPSPPIGISRPLLALDTLTKYFGAEFSFRLGYDEDGLILYVYDDHSLRDFLACMHEYSEMLHKEDYDLYIQLTIELISMGCNPNLYFDALPAKMLWSEDRPWGLREVEINNEN
jgi:hypothetical protein